MVLLNLKDCCARLKISRSTFLKLIKEKKFPPPVRLSERVLRWGEDDVNNYINNLLQN